MQGIHVLLPVWGPRYLRQCLDVCIPSLLAPGNVPAVAAAMPTTFTLMTRDRDMPRIHHHPAWQTLAATCNARLESIDDVLSQATSVVVTVAYARAIRAIGPAACEIGFVFLVADYVVADGGLKYVVDCLQGGADAVLAGNFQMLREATGPLFATAVPTGGVALSVPPRALVRVALDWLHPATSACMAEDKVAHDPWMNRIFWRVGSDTLLGRFYLMHMVAFRPQTVDVTIAAPCDYSFVPEFCPTGRIVTITDSDDYMVVEMQPVPRDAKGLGPGLLDAATMAGSLKKWVTAQHRRNAAHAIVYHAVETERDLAEAVNKSGGLVAETDRLLGPTVHPHRHHPYWVGALDHHQATALHPVDWAALGAILGPGGVPEAIGRLRRRLLGRMPLPRPWHPHWTDLRLVQEWLARLATGRSLLIVSTEPGRVCSHLMEAARTAGATNVTHFEPEEVIAAATRSPAPFDAALLIVRPTEARAVRELSDAVIGLLADDADIILALSDLSDADARVVNTADLEAVRKRLGSALRLNRLETVPAPRWRIAAQAKMMARARSAMGSHGMSARLQHLTAGIAYASLSLGANLACRRGVKGNGQGPCSTALFHLVRERPSPAAHAAPRAPAMAST